MTREEAIKELQGHKGIIIYPSERMDEVIDMAISALEQEPSDDELENEYERGYEEGYKQCKELYEGLREQKSGELITCKECKYFEHDSFLKGSKVPLIVAHEICKKWGGGCQTNKDGYCHLAEPYKEEGVK